MTFAELCEAIEFPIEPFQRRIVRAAASESEFVCLIPRGNGKNSLLAALAVHHLVTVPDPRVYVGAASRDQARILFEYARTFAERLGGLVIRHLELRVPEGHLRVLAADALKVHGLTTSLAIIDELHAHKDDTLYTALKTATLKRPGSQLITISTAGDRADSPLGRLRARALGQPRISRRGAVTDAGGPGLRMLEWSVAGETDLTPAAVKAANPASWLTSAALAGQREAVADAAFRRYRANQWLEGGGGAWLPAGAWQACVGEPAFTDGEHVWVGVDLGGEWSDSAVCWINAAGHVGCHIGSGEGAILEIAEVVEELAMRYTLAEVAFDPWRSGVLAQQLAERGVPVSHFPMTDTRTIPASARLHRAIVDGVLVLPDDPRLREHAATAVAKQSRRGWRIDKPGRSQQAGNIDGVVALMVALDIKESAPAPVRVLGFI